MVDWPTRRVAEEGVTVTVATGVESVTVSGAMVVDLQEPAAAMITQATRMRARPGCREARAVGRIRGSAVMVSVAW